MQGLILLNKTKNITSFGAVSVIKRLCGEKRVGHTGTLDPLATGVLPVLIGKATALSSYMLDADKKYIASVKLGITTDTEDIEGKILSVREVSVTDQQLSDVIEKFVGEISQRPPMYSAIKKDGIPMYERARRGEMLEIPERKITVYSLKITKPLDSDGCFELEAFVSKGTYIRSLVRDIGEALGCGATLTELCRTSSAGIDISECVSLDELNEANVKNYIISEERAVSYLREITVSSLQAERFTNGGQLSFKKLKASSFADGELLRVKYNDKLLGLGCANCEKQEIAVKCVINYPKSKTAIALGTFDGVHIAHRKVLDIPDGYKKIAVCFSKPPKMFFAGEDELLTEPQSKIEILKNVGMDEVVTLPFEEFKEKEAEEFLEYLKDNFSPSLICCGYDYRFGARAKGNIALLEQFCKENGIKLSCVKKVERNGKTVSSTALREMLKNGEVELANRLLSQPFSFTAKVISGDKRGRTIGFPTINQRYPKSLVKLRFGVYKTRVFIGESAYDGITNIGIRPTYPSDYVISETYIKNFSGDIYGEDVTVAVIGFLREEKKFSGADELKQQILLDLQG